MKPVSIWIVLAALYLPLFIGCSNAPPDLAPVSGHITLDGEPLGGAEVVFLPLLPGYDTAPESVAVTAADGSYQLEVFNTGQRGAIVGRHRVEIRLGEAESEVPTKDPYDNDATQSDCLPPQYNDESRLEFEVRPINQNVADFELKSLSDQ